MANQFTKGTRKTHDDSTKDRIRAEALARRLYKFAKAKGDSIGKHRMDAAQVAAAKVLIERGKPALQAIEQKIVEEPLTETQLIEKIEAQLHSLVENPGLKARLRALLDGSPTVVELPQRTAT